MFEVWTLTKKKNPLQLLRNPVDESLLRLVLKPVVSICPWLRICKHSAAWEKIPIMNTPKYQQASVPHEAFALCFTLNLQSPEAIDDEDQTLKEQRRNCVKIFLLAAKCIYKLC